MLSDIHPDVITVRDDDRKELAVERVRELKQEVYIRPNEGQRKVYLFADCGQLNERDQNVLLKIVEEGPAYAVFLFCAPSLRTADSPRAGTCQAQARAATRCSRPSCPTHRSIRSRDSGDALEQ